MFDDSPSCAPRVTGVGALRAHSRKEVGMKDEIKGKAHEIKGKVTGDKSEEMKGKAEQGVDKLKRTGRDVRDDLRDQAERMKHDHERDGDRGEREREAETVRERRSW